MASPPSFDRFRPHPWHGISVGDDAPELVNVYVEMTPSDWIKYEIDKETGYLTIDRPRTFTSQLPAAYGFIPRTYCGDGVGALSDETDRGDLDPLDICVVSENPIERAGILLSARIVGGLHMIDGGEADDKIIAVLRDDLVWDDVRDISELPKPLVERLRHYFLTYKMAPGEDNDEVQVETVYGVERAQEVLEASMKDYATLMNQ